MKMKERVYLITIIFLFIVFVSVSYYMNYQVDNIIEKYDTQSDTIHTSDTVIIYDTIKIIEPKTTYKEVVRVDTIAHIDTFVVTVPIERKIYEEEHYKAIIEGYNPNLISLDIYKKETFIYDTVRIDNTIKHTKTKRPKWAISAGPGLGYTPKGVEPYIGVSIGYVFWSR